FLSTRINFTEDLSAILGGRYSKYENKKNDKITSKTDNFLPYLALSYDITENLTTYVSYTEIFNPQSKKDRSGDYLDPETGFNYEVGLKGEWFDERLNSSIAL
ncbi:TonB-dependent receptor domain-containing protein, partial [Aliarcobacter lanthieri]